MWNLSYARNRGTGRRRARRGLGSRVEQLESRTLLSSAAFMLTSDWGTGFGGQITITNTSKSAVTNWTLDFTWDRSITQIWDGSVVSHTGNQYQVTNAGWNSTIPAGGTAEFGFNGASGNVGSDVPTGYTLNGVSISSGSMPTLSTTNVSVNDGTAGATAVFTVTLSQAETSAVTVDYGTANGTAIAGTNYTATSGTLSFSPGTTSQSVSVPISPDTVAGSNLTFNLNLFDATGAGLATTAATGTIVDTIKAPTSASAMASFEVTSDWGTGFGGQITITNNSSSPVNNWSLQFNWDRAITEIWNASLVSQTDGVTVVTNAGWNSTIAANSSVEFGFNGAPGNVGTDVPTNYILNGNSLGGGVPSLNINSVSVNDGTAGATAIFTVSLSQAAASNVTVKYATADGTAHAGTDYTATSGTLTFSPGTLTQTISVPITADTKSKPTETFTVNLTNPSGAGLATNSGTGTIVDTIGAPAQPPVANNVSAQTLEATAVTLNVLADASDPLGYTLSLSGYTQGTNGKVTESNNTLTYTPNAGFLGADSFTYTVSDGHGETATGTVSVTVVAPAAGANWPAHVFAPYVDMTLYPTYNLSTAMQSAGLKYFTLAFITADSNDLPAWGGYSSYEVNGGTFDKSIRTQISQVRAAGGDVSVSFGGEAGSELAQVVTNVKTLTADYQQVITAYGLTHIDFDIEGAAIADTASIDRRSQAIAALQQAAAANGQTLDVSFTLPVLPTGLTADGIYVLQSALKYGVKISMVNVMAMDYGDSAAPDPSGMMGTYAIDSAESTESQVAALYGTTLSTSQLWGMIGVTPMIGVNDQSDEVFEPSDASQLLAFAEKMGLGEIAMWSLARDVEDPNGPLNYAEDDSSSIVQTPFEFSDIFNAFTDYP